MNFDWFTLLLELQSEPEELPLLRAPSIHLETFDPFPYRALLPNLAWFLHAVRPKELEGIVLDAPSVDWISTAPFPKVALLSLRQDGQEKVRRLLYNEMNPDRPVTSYWAKTMFCRYLTRLPGATLVVEGERAAALSVPVDTSPLGVLH